MGVIVTAWLGLALFLLFISPVRAGVRVRWDETGLRGAAGLMIWGLRDQVDFAAERNAAGVPRLTAAFRGKDLPLPEGKNKGNRLIRLLGLLLRSNGQNAVFRRVVRVNTLSFTLRLGLQDAAALALAAGLLRAAGGAASGLRFRCVPALGGKSGLQAVCIAETRLGILMGAWMLWGRAKSKNRK